MQHVAPGAHAQVGCRHLERCHRRCTRDALGLWSPERNVLPPSVNVSDLVATAERRLRDADPLCRRASLNRTIRHLFLGNTGDGEMFSAPSYKGHSVHIQNSTSLFCRNMQKNCPLSSFSQSVCIVLGSNDIQLLPAEIILQNCFIAAFYLICLLLPQAHLLDRA